VKPLLLALLALPAFAAGPQWAGPAPAGWEHADGFLRTQSDYEDFRLSFEYKLDRWAEAAVIVRAPRSQRPQHAGLTLVLAHDFHKQVTPYVTGALMGVRPTLWHIGEDWGQWRKVEIEARGPRFKASIDGHLVQDLDASAVPELQHRLRRGRIVFPDMLHGYSIRGLVIEDLGKPTALTDLLSSRAFDGWTLLGAGHWRFNGDSLEGSDGHGVYYAPPELHDFEFTASVRTANRANAGVFFRGRPGENDRGFEVQVYSPVDAVYPTGSIYGLTRSRLAADTEGRWFLLQVRVAGSTCEVRIDGELVAHTDELPAKYVRPGRVGFQIHMEKTRVEFRDVYVRSLNDEPSAPPELLTRARRYQRAISAADRLLLAWLDKADPRTLLLPDRTDSPKRVYTPHNSGADLYPYLVLTADLTRPHLFRGRMLEMLRNEIRFTSPHSAIPGNLDLDTSELSKPSLFGAGEYAKDGLVTVTERLGRSPWFDRMRAMIDEAMLQSPVREAELDGDYLQVLVRLAAMTGDDRYLDRARAIADVWLFDLLPASPKLRLRDHGNETVVGLTLLFALESERGTPHAARYRPAVQAMLDRILASANPGGMLYNEIDWKSLQPLGTGLSDNWGYVYGAVYTFYQVTGETKYRDAVVRVLGSLSAYRRYNWEPSSNAKDKTLGSFDGYADAIESAIYLANREPVPEALAWIDSEMDVMLGMQRPDGHVEDWYGEGNFNRTALLYADFNSLGVRPSHWVPGLGIGAIRKGDSLELLIHKPGGWRGPVRFDTARHRRDMNFRKNYVRLNEFPEWFVVDANTLYSLKNESGVERIHLGSELIAGVEMNSGLYTIAPLSTRSQNRP
jgi:hypothetical protein